MDSIHMFWIVTAILTGLWRIKLVLCNVDSISYTIHHVSTIPYGDPISTVQVRSILECFARCTEFVECNSTTYSPAMKLCHMNRAGVHPEVNPGPCTASCIMRYATKIPQTQVCTMGQSCVSNSDCAFGVGLECRSGQCACTLGYSFLPGLCDCVTACGTYGTTFAVLPGSKMVGDNTKVLLSIANAAACHALCVTESTFVCKTLEYNTGNGRCQLQDYTVLQQPADYTLDPNFDLHVRNCA